MRISILCVMEAKTRAIGYQNKLLWHLPLDMKRFKALRLGKPVIMGRKTWDSIDSRYKPLQGSENLVVSRNPELKIEGATVCLSVGSAMMTAGKNLPLTDESEILIIGGEEIYREALPGVSRLYLTLVHDNAFADGLKEADAFFPEYKDLFPHVISCEHLNDGKERDIFTEFRILERA
jgi:dihydrofolate reductase